MKYRRGVVLLSQLIQSMQAAESGNEAHQTACVPKIRGRISIS